MGEVIKFRRPSAVKRAQGKTLCSSGFHKWQVAQKKQFDVHRGPPRHTAQLRTLRRHQNDARLNQLLLNQLLLNQEVAATAAGIHTPVPPSPQ